jgi:hypothetical protein
LGQVLSVSTNSIYHYILRPHKLQSQMVQTKYSTRRFNMLSFLKKIFGAKTTEPAPVPYKVEKPESKVAEFPFPSAKPVAEKKPAVKKPATKTKPVRKPKAPKA